MWATNSIRPDDATSLLGKGEVRSVVCGCKDALRRVQRLLTAGYVWVLDADLKGYFDNISPERLMALVRRKVADRRVLQLLERYLHQEVLDGLDRWRPETGTPQGAVLSPLLAKRFLC